jgi:hypothetical protein
MKAHFYLEGTNEGASFLESYVGQEVDLISPRKEISPDVPALVDLHTLDKKTHSLQLIDIRFIDQFIFIHCFVYLEEDKGGKALLRLEPCS